MEERERESSSVYKINSERRDLKFNVISSLESGLRKIFLIDGNFRVEGVNLTEFSGNIESFQTS